MANISFNDDAFTELFVTEGGACFPILVKWRRHAKRILVFGQSAISNRDGLTLPIYHRWTWSDDFPNATCIWLSDPTLHLSETLLGGWFQGEPEHFYAETAAQIIANIASLCDIPTELIYFYGSSAGGFSSIVMADELNANAIAEIPQINMTKYHVKSVTDELLKHSLKCPTMDIAKEKFEYRMNIIARLTQRKSIPNITILQNVNDNIHMKNHIYPLLESLSAMHDTHTSLAHRRFRMELFANRGPTGDGHVVATKQFTLDAIRQTMRDLEVSLGRQVQI